MPTADSFDFADLAPDAGHGAPADGIIAVLIGLTTQQVQGGDAFDEGLVPRYDPLLSMDEGCGLFRSDYFPLERHADAAWDDLG